jgi:predicted nucleotidyltransferase
MYLGDDLLNNKSQIINTIKMVANALADLNDECIYVGGAVTGLYADDPLAPKVRPTKDIDIVLEIVSLIELERLRQKLAERNIRFAQEENTVCRFKYKHILIDVMSTNEVGWAPANQWFKGGLDNAEIYHLDDVKIKIMPFVYFLASKFSAFRGRGKDPRTSRDFEDIVYVLDNRTTFVKDILEAAVDVKNFLVEELILILQEPTLQEAVMAHLESETSAERYEMLVSRIDYIHNNLYPR